MKLVKLFDMPSCQSDILEGPQLSNRKLGVSSQNSRMLSWWENVTP